MIRLLFILPDLNGGGAERVVLNLLRHLSPDRYQITLFLIKEQGIYWDEVPSYVRVVCATRRGRAPYILPWVLAKLLPLAKSHDVVIGALELNATYLAYLAGRLLGKPVLGWVHINLPEHITHYRTYHQVAVRHIYRHLNDVVFVSSHAMAAAKQWLNREATGWKSIANIFDLATYESKKNSVLADEDTLFSQPVVISIGRLSRQKGFDVLIAAHARLRRSGVAHHLLILGEGSERQNLTDLAVQQGVADSVFMPGFVANPLIYLKRAHHFVLSSRYEGFAFVLLEALSCGLPTVATNCPSGPAEILQDGRVGLLVAMEDAQALADAMRRLLQEPMLCADLKARGLQRMADFSPKEIAELWGAIFQDLVSH